MPKINQFEQFNDSTPVLQFLSEREEQISKLLFDGKHETSDLFCIYDSRLPAIGGFSLYLKKDGTLTTNILEAILMHKKDKKQLISLASSYQDVKEIPIEELMLAREEYRGLATNY